jgi:GNAT superfamily N-acetyltransferase
MVSKPVDRDVNHKFRITIDPATIEDTKEISTVLARSFYKFQGLNSLVYPLLQFTIREDLRYRLRSHSPLYCCLVAKVHQQPNSASDSEDIVVATAEIALRSNSFWSSDRTFPYISNLAVDRDYRRLGIGSQLLSKCEQTALEWGYHETRLHVLDSNYSAKQLYYNYGYQISKAEANWGMWFDYSPRLLLKKSIQT